MGSGTGQFNSEPAMINESILLLVYYYKSDLRSNRLLRYAGKYLGAYLPFNLYLYEPLQRIFSKALLYDYLERMAEIGIRAVNQEVIELVRRERPRYVLWVSWRHDILPETLDTIRKEGSIVIGWFFDDEWRFNEYSKWWVPHLDYCVTNAAEAMPKYRALGARVIHTIPNTGVAVDQDWSKVEAKYDVSFVGSRFYADREQWIGELNSRKIPVHFFGEDWGGYVSFEEMINIFQYSRINLNFSKDLRNFRPQIKGRIFQVCLAGGFLLTEYVPGIEEYFEIDKEIVCFRDADEMAEKINYFLQYDKERRAIAQAGWKRAVGEYTSFHMVSRVFNQIEDDRRLSNNRGAPVQMITVPLWIRRHAAAYHFEWVRTWLEEDRISLARDELTLSLSCYPFSIGVLYYYFLSFLPSLLRRVLVKPYKWAEKSFLAWLYTKFIFLFIPEKED
jgi:spore maturation protein CgeB